MLEAHIQPSGIAVPTAVVKRCWRGEKGVRRARHRLGSSSCTPWPWPWASSSLPSTSLSSSTRLLPTAQPPPCRRTRSCPPPNQHLVRNLSINDSRHADLALTAWSRQTIAARTLSGSSNWRPADTAVPFSISSPANAGFRFVHAGGWRHGPVGSGAKGHHHIEHPARAASLGGEADVLLFPAKKRTDVLHSAHRHRPGPPLWLSASGPDASCPVLEHPACPASSLRRGRHPGRRIASFT